ncbi:MAG: serine hydrolase domain-containing protein [Beutenbergiaceae bacterium]
MSTTAEVIPVHGTATGAFAPLKDVFGRMVGDQGGGGASLVIRHHGQVVVDVHGGDFDDRALVPVYSVSKLVTAIAITTLEAAGELDLDEPLSLVWPDLDKAETAAITLRMVLSHRSGLVSFDRRFTLDELLSHADDAAIATQRTYWEPGSAHGYHAVSYGTLVDGYLRRKLGRSTAELVAERVATPLNAEFWLGAPASVLDRIHAVEYQPGAVTDHVSRYLADSPIPPSPTGHIRASVDFWNSRDVHTASLPSSSGIASAHGLASILAATLDGTVLNEAARDRMVATQARGHDQFLGIDMHYGSGVQLPCPQLPFLGPGSYGHEGAGGTLAFADREFDIALAWTTSVFPRMAGASPGSLALLSTLRHCLTADQSTVD